MDRSDSWILVDEIDLTTEMTAPDTPSVKKSPAVETHEPLAAVAVDEPTFSAIDAAVEVWELEELEAIEAWTPISVDPLPAKPKKSGERSMPFLPFVMLIVGFGLIRLAVEALVREDSCALRTLAVASSPRSRIRPAHPARQALSMVDSPSQTTVTTARLPTALLELEVPAVNDHSVQPGCDEIRWTHPPSNHALAPIVCNRSSGSAPMSAGKKVFTHWNGSSEREDVLTRALLVPIPQRRWRTMADTLTERRKQASKATSVPPSRFLRLLASHALALAPATAPRADRFASYAVLPDTSAAATAIVAPIPVPTSALASVPASLPAAAPAAYQVAAAVAVAAAALPSPSKLTYPLSPSLAGLQIAPPKPPTPASASASTPASASASTVALALAIASAEAAALEWAMAPDRRERRSVQRAAFDAEMQRQWQLRHERQLGRTVTAVALVVAATSSPATTPTVLLTTDQSLQLSRLSRALALRRNTSRALVVVASTAPTSTVRHSARRASAPVLALPPGSVPAGLLSWVPPACRDLVISCRSLIAFSSSPARRYSNRSSNSPAQRVPLTARQLGCAAALHTLPAPPVSGLFLTSPPASRLAMAFLPSPLGAPGVTRTVAVAAVHAKQAATVDLQLAPMRAEVRRLRRELSSAQAVIYATASQYLRTATELEYARSELHVQHVRLEATQTLAQVAQVSARAEAAARVRAENSRVRAEAARAKAEAAAKHARRRSAVLASQVRQTKKKQREQQALPVRKHTQEMKIHHDEPRAPQRQHGNGKVGGGGRASGYSKAEKMAHKMKHRHRKHGREGH